MSHDATRLRLLASFWYYGKHDFAWVMQEYFPHPDGLTTPVLADSGAYSAHQFGQEIDLGAYAAWVEQNATHFTWYANLDVKGDWRQGLRNQRTLEARGLRPLPVFHGGEPWGLLRELCQAYPYVALGGMAASNADGGTRERWMASCFEVAAPYRTAFHGFGMTTWAALRRFPFYSVDSSSWAASYRYGHVNLLDDATGQFVGLRLGDHAGVYAQAALLRDYGIDPAVFADRAKYSFRWGVRVGGRCAARQERLLRKIHGEVPGPAAHHNFVIQPGEQAPPAGPHIYLADSNLSHVSRAHCAILTDPRHGDPGLTEGALKGFKWH